MDQGNQAVWISIGNVTMQYVVSSPTRTGSHYLQSIIRACYVPVIKTHDPLFVVDYPTTVLCLIKRKDMFAAIMSSIIWEVTKESAWYKKQIQPFEADLKVFDGCFHHQFNYESQHDFSRPYANVYKFLFEDILQNTQLVFDALGIQPVGPVWSPPKSPHRYDKLILNQEQCWARYQYWCNIYNIKEQ